MKRVAILTLPLWNNYGGILQAYALNETLKKFGFKSSLIDFHKEPESKIDYIEKTLKNSIKSKVISKFKSDIKLTQTKKIQEYISKNTRNFVENNIFPKTDIINKRESLLELNNDFDAFIVGSDQVWRSEYTPGIKSYYLDFVTDNNQRISYAASFGKDSVDYSSEELEYCKVQLSKFCLVTTREKAGRQIIKEHFGTDSHVVLDPTMLLRKSDYLKLLPNIEKSVQNRTLFCYVLDRNKSIDSLIKTVSDNFGFQPFEVKPKLPDENFSLKNEEYICPPVESWLEAFYKAEYIIADSFHGCVFAIIFNKPFIAIGNKGRGLSRFTTLLEKFDLMNRLIIDINDVSINELFNYEFNWEKINDILNSERDKSIKLLLNSLNK